MLKNETLEWVVVLASLSLLCGCEDNATSDAPGDKASTANSKEGAVEPSKPAAPSLPQTMSLTDMTAEARRAGRPHVPDGWKPEEGDKVVKEIGDWGLFDYYVVTRVVGDDAYLKFGGWGDEMKTPEPVDKLVPVPEKSSGALPSAGGYVVAPKKPNDVKWVFARVVAVSGKNVTIAVAPEKDKKTDLQERMVRAGEFILVD